MRPDENELDDEIRGHLAINIKERIDRGEDPEAARLAALREFGYVPRLREEMRRVWYGRWFDMADAMAQDMRVGLRSLMRAKGLAATVVITLALGIGANAAIFSLVRGVLLRPLANREEDRLVYIRQSARGIDADNVATFEEYGSCETVNCSRRAGFSQFNLRVSRTFPLTRGVRIEAIGEVFNLFNAKNPVLALTQRRINSNGTLNTQFMQPSAYAGDVGQTEQRIGQIGFRLTF